MKTHRPLLNKLVFIIATLILVYGNLFAQGPYNGSGNWLRLDGTDDYASITDNLTLDIGNGETDDFTIECFFYIPDINGSGSKTLILKNSSYNLYLILSNTAQDRIVFRIYTSFYDYIYITYDVDLSTGCHHIAASYDNEYTSDNDAMQIFLDGNRIINSFDFEITPGLFNSTSALNIGAYNGVNSFYGNIDEVRISDIIRYGSTYTIPSSDFVVDGNTRALWHFSESEGSTSLNDETANKNTLTGFNGAQTSGSCTAPNITGTTNGSRCGTGTVDLGATASEGTINWYSTPTGGISLGTGTSFTTPSISSTTVYYVDATNSGCTTTTRTAVTASVTCTHISSILSVDLFKVYPNPTDGIFEIFIDESIHSKVKLELYNNLGCLIYKTWFIKSENSLKIDLSCYSAGIYLVIIYTKRGVFQHKIIKE